MNMTGIIMISYIEWFTEQTYTGIKALLIHHSEIPDSCKEWLDLKTRQIADIEASGNIAKKVEIDPIEFSNYCYRKALDCDIAALRRFTFLKGSGHEPS
jgi:hypothetical protein